MSIKHRYLSAFATGSVILCLFFAALALLAGFGNRLEWWSFHTGISLLKWAAYGEVVSITGSFISLAVAAFRSRSALMMSVISTIIGVAALAIPVLIWVTAHRVPAIHDITTDTGNPPKFKALLDERRNARNPAEYGGERIARLQHKAYPDIVPFVTDMPPERAFGLAFRAAQKMGWKIAVADPSEGRIEATATTFWFGFKDDVVIRIKAQEYGSRIDVRSLSRVGVSDIGTNARRIRAYLKMLKKLEVDGT